MILANKDYQYCVTVSAVRHCHCNSCCFTTAAGSLDKSACAMVRSWNRNRPLFLARESVVPSV